MKEIRENFLHPLEDEKPKVVREIKASPLSRRMKRDMLGCLELFQEHPFKGPANYTGLVWVCGNLDLQDLRRVLASHTPLDFPGIGDV